MNPSFKRVDTDTFLTDPHITDELIHAYNNGLFSVDIDGAKITILESKKTDDEFIVWVGVEYETV